MKEKIAKMLHIEVNEGKQLGENINKIINDYYKEVELTALMPSKIFKGTINLHKALFPTNKINTATLTFIEKLSQESDEKRKEALKKEEELKKKAESQKIEVSVQTTPEKNPPQKTEENQTAADKSTPTAPTATPAVDFQDILHFLSDKSPAFKIISLKYLLTNKKLDTFKDELRKLLTQAVKENSERISLFENIIEKKNQGLTLSEILKQRIFSDLLEDFSRLAKKMDVVGTDDEKAFLKQFLHQFKSESQRQYELLCLLITHKQCKNPSVKKLLEKLFKKWPQKNDKKDERIIVEVTKRYLDLL